MYEYKTVLWKKQEKWHTEWELLPIDAESLETLCNLHGANGWELSHIKERWAIRGKGGATSILIFKRPLRK
mgnify:CR=1 FL=1